MRACRARRSPFVSRPPPRAAIPSIAGTGCCFLKATATRAWRACSWWNSDARRPDADYRSLRRRTGSADRRHRALPHGRVLPGHPSLHPRRRRGPDPLLLPKARFRAHGVHPPACRGAAGLQPAHPAGARVAVWCRPLPGTRPEPAQSAHPQPGRPIDDKSDVGALFENVGALLAQGQAEVRGEVRLGRHTTLHLIVSGAPGQTMAGVHRYELLLDTTTRFPLQVVSRDQTDAVIETVVMDDLEIDVPRADALFDPG